MLGPELFLYNSIRWFKHLEAEEWSCFVLSPFRTRFRAAWWISLVCQREYICICLLSLTRLNERNWTPHILYLWDILVILLYSLIQWGNPQLTLLAWWALKYFGFFFGAFTLPSKGWERLLNGNDFKSIVTHAFDSCAILSENDIFLVPAPLSVGVVKLVIFS